MSRKDFTQEEFVDRRARVRAALAAQGLDWLVAVHPVSIHWLTGSDAKSYQEFQCLLISAAPGPVVVLTREGERHEFRDDALVGARFSSMAGASPRIPVAAFGKIAERFGLLKARVGLEVPGFYLHPHHYVALKALLGPALVAEPTNLVHGLKLVKSPTELRYIREAARIGDLAMARFRSLLAPGRTELELGGAVYETLMANGSGVAASPINIVSGEHFGLQPWRADAAPAEVGR